MKKWRKNGVRRHSKTLETVENKGVVERNEIRNRKILSRFCNSINPNKP